MKRYDFKVGDKLIDRVILHEEIETGEFNPVLVKSGWGGEFYLWTQLFNVLPSTSMLMNPGPDDILTIEERVEQ